MTREPRSRAIRCFTRKQSQIQIQENEQIDRDIWILREYIAQKQSMEYLKHEAAGVSALAEVPLLPLCVSAAVVEHEWPMKATNIIEAASSSLMT